MLTKWLTKLEPIRKVTTREELEAVFRFRYTVYWEEYGRSLGETDHENRWVFDEHDEKDYTTILYSGSLDDMTGTVRLLHWEPGKVPGPEFDELSMDLFPAIEERYTAEIGRFMIRKSLPRSRSSPTAIYSRPRPVSSSSTARGSGASSRIWSPRRKSPPRPSSSPSLAR